MQMLTNNSEYNVQKRQEMSFDTSENLIKQNTQNYDSLFNTQTQTTQNFDLSYELIIDYINVPVQYQVVKTTDKVIFDRAPIPHFPYKGQMITRQQLNDSFMKSILFNISKYHSRFVSNIDYFSKTDFIIYHPNVNNYVEYNPETGLYKIDLDNPQFGVDKLNEDYVIEQVVELYNVTRNETYMVVNTTDRTIEFLAPDTTQEIRDDIIHSFYRITMYVSKKNVIEEFLDINITSTYDLFFDKFFYVLKYVGDSKFDVFSIDFNQLQYYLQKNQLSFSDILDQIQSNDYSLGTTGINGVVKEQVLDFEVYNTRNIHDLTISINVKEPYTGEHSEYLNKLNVGDIFYFYVNRTETFTIVIDDVTGNRTHISQDEFSSIFEFDNCNYLIRGTFYVFDQLPIRIQNRKNITINGIDASSSIINFNKQDFSNTDCLFEVVDCIDVTFKDMKLTTYELFNSEIRPETYTTDKQVYQVKVTQTRDDMRTSDMIRLEHLDIENVEQQLIVDNTEGHVYTPEPPRTYVEHITFKPHGLDILEVIVGQQSQYVPPLDVIQILPFKDILIGDGTQEVMSFNPKDEIIHFTTSTPNHLTYTFDDTNNRIQIDVVNVQNQYHYHSATDIVNGILPIARGGTGNDTYDNNGIIIYNQTTNRFETHFTKDDIVNEQRQAIQIHVVDENNTEQFVLRDTDNFKIRSLTPHIVIGFDAQQKEVNFDIFDLVTTVNGKTGDVVLDYTDVGQQSEDHLHDDRYVQLTELDNYYTKTETDNLLDELKNSIVVEVIDVVNDPSTITNPQEGDIYQIGTGQLNEWMGMDGNFQVYNGTGWDFVQSFESQLQYSKSENKIYICRYDYDENDFLTKSWVDFVYYGNVQWVNIDFTNSKIEDIENVEVDTGLIQDGWILKWDNIQSKWVQKENTLETLLDFDTSTRNGLNTPVIYYDNTDGNYKFLELDNYFNKQNDSIFDINELNGLTLNDNDILTWDQQNGKFKQTPMNNVQTTLSSLQDVDLTGLQDGYLLQYDGTAGVWRQVEPTLTLDGGII